MRQSILAKRYAKALFAVGKEEKDRCAEYSQALNDLAALLNEHAEIMDALTNPLYPMDIRAKVMEHLIKAMQPGKSMANFLKLLVQKKRANVIPDIAEVFQAMVDADQNISRGTVVSATALNKELQAKVQAALEKITGKKVILDTEIDPSIIGGMFAKVGDLVMDGSIKTQLAGLKESIKGSE